MVAVEGGRMVLWERGRGGVGGCSDHVHFRSEVSN